MITLNLSAIGNILRKTKELKSVPECSKNIDKPLTVVSDEVGEPSIKQERKKAFSISQMIPPPLTKQ